MCLGYAEMKARMKGGPQMKTKVGVADAEGNRVAPADLGLPAAIPEEVRHVVTSPRLTEARPS